MRIEVSLSPALYPYRTIKEHHITVAIDLLRATTAVCAAFQAGCSMVAPLNTLEGMSRFRDQGFLLAAERDGKKVGNAEYGNSPTEYLRNDLSGVKLSYSTTNGTVTILCGADAEMTLVGSFANLSALCKRLTDTDLDVVLLCSGWKQDFCIEDTLVAGAIIQKLLAINPELIILNDAAHMALALWQVAMSDPYEYCQRCTHVHRLYRLGAADDVRFAFHQDTCPVVPILKDGLLTL